MIKLATVVSLFFFEMAIAYRNATGEDPSGPLLRHIEESCFYLIDLAKCFNLDLKKILNHTTKSGETLFDVASVYSETITRRLLEEDVQVNSVNDSFVTPFFRVRIIISFQNEIFGSHKNF